MTKAESSKDANLILEYIDQIEDKWREPFKQIFQIFEKELVDQGEFELTMQNGMPSFTVPHSLYPAGYHVTGEPLPFISLAAQKCHLAVYHMGLYSNPTLMNWFETEYPQHMTTKLNMGKSCIRFTNAKTIPFELLEQLASKMDAQDWIQAYDQRNE